MRSSLYTFFYGGPFSQWYPSTFIVDGATYCTAEQFMMAMKALYFKDMSALAKIMSTRDPSEQKAIGRTVKNFNAEAWNSVSRGFVYKGNMAKFSQNPKLLADLLDTEGTLLVEASPYDSIWGVGLSAKDPKILDKANWKGTNWLGETLTKVREDLKNAGKS